MDSSNQQALSMLDAFTSVGPTHFYASRIAMEGKLIAFRPGPKLTN